MIREWLTRLDEEPLRAALAALLDVGGSAEARERLMQIANTAGLESSEFEVVESCLHHGDPLEGWTVSRISGGFALRWTGDDDPFELQILGDTVRILTRGTPDATSADSDDEQPELMEEALDASAGPVLRWLRTSGSRPAQASRLAALYAPRPRGISWPSSLP